MTDWRRPATAAALLPLAAVAACTGGADRPAQDGTPARTPRATASAPAARERSLEHQVQTALGITATEDDDPTFVEGGSERVADGIHTRPALPRGRSYTLTVVCSGTGTVRLSVVAREHTEKPLTCDGTPTHVRITGTADPVEIDVEPLPDASGMTAWRVDRVPRGA
ncbi:hypothetical protein [Streptomyces sp. NPDC088785]|uniref:hypothetical protein n=1 Tax=Streptomyces sp. NPDC088785 TaxID=3365897 RepID=UPI003805C7BC